jgi:hypothetical protein
MRRFIEAVRATADELAIDGWDPDDGSIGPYDWQVDERPA